MNQQQTKYLRERIAVITKQKISKIDETMKLPKPCMSLEEKFKAIKSGAATLKTYSELDDYSRWHHAYIYKDDIKFASAYEKAKKLKDAAVAKVHKDAQILVDELMLGDAEQALAKLQKFEQS